MKHKVASKIVNLFILLALIFPQGALAQGETPSEGVSPLQEALQAQFAERAAAGEEIPSVTYNYLVEQPVSRPSSPDKVSQESPTIVATTVIEYDNPQEAGYDAWPSLDPEGSKTHFDELYYNEMEKLIPGFWSLYEFGQEPRRMTYVEKIQLTAPLPNQMPRPSKALVHSPTEDILMGFTFAGPNLDYTLNSSYEACVWIVFYGDVCGSVYNVEAGFKLNTALGLRLPAKVTLSGPTQMDLSSAYNLSATLTTAITNPQDATKKKWGWQEEDYIKYNVEGLDGKEFVLSVGYFLGLKVEIAGVDFCKAISAGAWGCYAEQGIDESADFETPLGSGTSFPIPPGNIEVATWGLGALFDNGKKAGENASEPSEEEYNILDELLNVAVGVQLTPLISSTDISAHWDAMGGSDCVGGGTIHFAAPGIPVTVGPVSVCPNGASDESTVRLSDFRYNFDQFQLKFGTYLDFTVVGFPVHLSYDFFSVDLSQLTQDIGLYLGQHYQCAWQDLAHPFVCGSTNPDNVVELTRGLNLSASDHDFANQLVGMTSDAFSFTLTNTGNGDLNIGTLTASGDYALSANTCNNATIISGGNCLFSVTFTPTTYGVRTGTVTIPNTAPGSPHLIALSGNGVSIPDGTNLLLNPGFDQTILWPKVWTYSVLNKPFSSLSDCSIFLSPNCSLRLTGERLTRLVTQTISRVGLAGDQYIFGLASGAANIPSGGNYKLDVIFYNRTKIVTSQTLILNDGTHGFETVHLITTVPGAYNKIVFRITLQKAKGTAWFDDAFLMQLP